MSPRKRPFITIETCAVCGHPGPPHVFVPPLTVTCPDCPDGLCKRTDGIVP